MVPEWTLLGRERRGALGKEGRRGGKRERKAGEVTAGGDRPQPSPFPRAGQRGASKLQLSDPALPATAAATLPHACWLLSF